MKKYNKLIRKLGKLMYSLSAAFLIAAMLVNVIPPTTAYAHHPELSGNVTCAVDGRQQVTWTINNWSGTTLPMKITAINRSVGVAVDTMVPVSVQGVEYLPGSQTGTITLTVSGKWSNGATGTTSATVNLPGSCQAPDYKLNLSHIYCYEGDSEDLDGMVEIHFVLLNVPDGITPGILIYTYGTIVPGMHTGNIWHYFDYKPSGTYDVQSASVVVGGVTVYLHNPGSYADTYSCGEPPVVPGCMDQTADNFNPLANQDDGSCTYTVPGCTDQTANNFNPLANQDDGSCTYTVSGCTDKTAENYNPLANQDDGSCTYPSTYTICWGGITYYNVAEADLVNYPGYKEGECSGPIVDPVDVKRVCTAFTFENKNPIKINGNWMIEGTDLAGFFSLDPFESMTINTGYHAGDLKINSGDFAFSVAVPTNCDSSSVLIPVTGVDIGSFGSFGSQNLFFASIAFLGLGMVLSGVSRKLEE